MSWKSYLVQVSLHNFFSQIHEIPHIEVELFKLMSYWNRWNTFNTKLILLQHIVARLAYVGTFDYYPLLHIDFISHFDYNTISNNPSSENVMSFE